MFHDSVAQFKLQGLIVLFLSLSKTSYVVYFILKNANILVIGRCLCLILTESRIYTIWVFLKFDFEAAARQTSHLCVHA